MQSKLENIWKPIILVCENPETCEIEHNEVDGLEHHYGCECTDCMLYYYLHLK